MRVRQKPPLSYYGGKQNMLKHILPMIPHHEIYVEPFAGGAAVFFAKKPCKVEVLNDTNDRLITFYRVLKTKFDELNTMIQGTLHSESDYYRAKDIYQNQGNYTDVEIAWAVWVQCNMSFGNKIEGGFAFNDGRKKRAWITKGQFYKKERMDNLNLELSHTYFFSRSFFELPELYNNPEAFYYIDPPYLNSECGHYGGWTEEDEKSLMKWIEKINGKFLLSGYPNKIRDSFIDKNGWNYKEIEQTLSVSGKDNKGKKKIETLIWNYEIEGQTLSLFG